MLFCVPLVQYSPVFSQLGPQYHRRAGELTVLDGRVRARVCRRFGERTFFLKGSSYGLTEAATVWRWVRDFDPDRLGSWAGRFDADFNLVEWEEASATVYVAGDRVGAHRLFVHNDQDLVTITHRMLDQVCLQEHPGLDSFGVYALLTLLYPLDPGLLLAGTPVVSLGDLATCTAAGTRLSSYARLPAMEPTPALWIARNLLELWFQQVTVLEPPDLAGPVGRFRRQLHTRSPGLETSRSLWARAVRRLLNLDTRDARHLFIARTGAERGTSRRCKGR